MVTPTYEWHSKKYDKGVQPGQNFTIEYALGQYLHERFEVTVHGYHQWQITDDRGHAAVNKDTHDMNSGIGAGITAWIIPEKFSIYGKVVKEYGVKDRLDGWVGEINVVWIF